MFTEAGGAVVPGPAHRPVDEAGARELAGELGFLPLALAQAAAVIAAQHLDYPAYLARLRAVPVQDLLKRATGEPYPHGAAEAIVLALDAVADGDPTGPVPRPDQCGRAAVGRRGVPGAAVRRRAARPAPASGTGDGRRAAISIDEALGRLASASLLTFSADDATVSAHRLTMRVAGNARPRRTAWPGSARACGAAGSGDRVAGPSRGRTGPPPATPSSRSSRCMSTSPPTWADMTPR